MMTPMHLTLTAILLVAAATDLTTQRIPNALTYPAIIAALAYHGLTNGTDGLLFSLGGLALGLGVMLAPYLLGVMGAGDVKLMAAVGALLGLGGALDAFILTTLLGGLYACGILLLHQRLFGAILRNFWRAAMLLPATRHFDYAPHPGAAHLPKLCYGVAIAFGSICAMLLGSGALTPASGL
ncbi:prepilin peptidase [Desulfobaculum senezii]